MNHRMQGSFAFGRLSRKQLEVLEKALNLYADLDIDQDVLFIAYELIARIAKLKQKPYFNPKKGA